MNNKVLAAVIAVAVIAAAGVAVYYHLNKDPGGDPPLELKDEFDLGDYYTYTLSQNHDGKVTTAKITYTIESITGEGYEVEVDNDGTTTPAGVLDRNGFLREILMTEDMKSSLTKGGTESCMNNMGHFDCDIWTGTADGMQMKMWVYPGSDVVFRYEATDEASGITVTFMLVVTSVFDNGTNDGPVTPPYHIRDGFEIGDHVTINTTRTVDGSTTAVETRVDVLSMSNNYVGVKTTESSSTEFDVLGKAELMDMFMVKDGSILESGEWTKIGAKYMSVSGVTVPCYEIRNQSETQTLWVVESSDSYAVLNSDTTLLTSDGKVVHEVISVSMSLVERGSPTAGTVSDDLEFDGHMDVGDFVVMTGWSEENGTRYEQTMTKIVTDVSADGMTATVKITTNGRDTVIEGDRIESFFDRSYCSDTVNIEHLGTGFRQTVYGSVLCDHVRYVDYNDIVIEGWLYHGTPIFAYVEMSQGYGDWSSAGVASIETNMLVPSE